MRHHGVEQVLKTFRQRRRKSLENLIKLEFHVLSIGYRGVDHHAGSGIYADWASSSFFSLKPWSSEGRRESTDQFTRQFRRIMKAGPMDYQASLK